MPHSLHLSRRPSSLGTPSRRRSPLFAVIIALGCLALLNIRVSAQATQPAQGCLGTFATALVQGGMAPCTLHVDATELPLAHGRPLTAMYEWDFGDPIDPPPRPTTQPGAGSAVPLKPPLGASPDRP